jgi:hypothetical protein
MNKWHHVNNRINKRRTEILLFFFLLFSYAYTFPRWADPNQNSRLNMVVAVVEDGTFRIDPYVGNTVDYAKVGDHYYSDKAPGTAFAGIPVYAILKLVFDLPAFETVTDRLSNHGAFQATLREDGTGVSDIKVKFAVAQVVLAFLFAAVPTAVIGLLLFWLTGKFSQNTPIRVAVILVYGLLTPVLAYANAFYGHQFSAALVFLVFYLAWEHRERFTTMKALLSGFLLAYSVITEYPVALLAGLVFLYLGYQLYQQRDLKKLGWVAGAGMLTASGWMFYNNAIFGSPFELGYKYSELWVDQHSAGFMSLTRPHWDAIWGITFSPFRGLFFYSPILLLALPGFYLWWKTGKHRVECVVAFVSCAVLFLFNASSIMWWGGFAIGPRYLLAMLPFMALALFFGVEAVFRSKVASAAAGAAAVWALLATWGLSIAGQAFPPDTIDNPLFIYALPAWIQGDIARNTGTLIGLEGISSLIPYAFISTVFMFLLFPIPVRARSSTGLDLS